MPSKINIAVLGLGYVGLPLMLALSKKFSVTGFDTSAKRIRDLKNGVDHAKESKPQELHKIKNLLTNSVSHIQDSNVFIVTVPTPINNNKTPDLRFINSACKIIGNILKKK